MEEAVLKVGKSKKGKITGDAIFSDGKKMPVPSDFALKEELNDCSCQIERSNGQIVKIVVDGQEVEKKKEDSGKKQSKSRHNSFSGGGQERGKNAGGNKDHKDTAAKAPYNFVPLNDKPVPPPQTVEKVTLDRYHTGNFYTGYIELEIETKTPLFIRGTEVSKDYFDFFAPAGVPQIPGSSLRGLVRNLVEIVSFAHFEPGRQFEDKKLYFRSIADKAISLRKEYQSRMVDHTQNHALKVKSGFLVKQAGSPPRYYIKPSVYEAGVMFYKVEEDLVKKNVTDNIKPFQDPVRVYFKPQPAEDHQHRRLTLRYPKVNKVQKEPSAELKEGWLLVSGKMPNKHMHWIVNPPDETTKELKIDNQVIENYKNDVNREGRANLLERLKKNPNGVPCFYITDQQGEVISFGHTGMFRLAYDKSIAEHVPEDLKAAQEPDPKKFKDIPEALFGRESYFASRVYFEDAFLAPGQQNVLMDFAYPQILNTPKPTTFQHYLNQGNRPEEHEVPKGPERLHTWNSDAHIRGYKFYWHKAIRDEDWQESKEIRNKDLYPGRIKPVKSGTKFKGCIRFDNLTKEEVGALLFVLDLPGNCMHKLGLGKPLGMGSVKITPRLVLSDRSARYQQLFDNTWEWHLAEQIEDNLEDYKAAFATYVLEQLNRVNSKFAGEDNLWETKRLKELRTILDWDNTKLPTWIERTRYMELEKKDRNAPKGKRKEFENRPVLDSPCQFVKK